MSATQESVMLTIDGVPTDVIPFVRADLRAAVARCLNAALADGEFMGRIPETAVAASGIAIEELADALVPVAAQFALCPVSHFRVGAVARCGRVLYLGANAEYPGGPIVLSVHAEQCSVSQAIAMGRESCVDSISVSAEPCGFCRQFLVEQEFHQNSRPIALRIAGQPPTDGVPALLPRAFTPAALTNLLSIPTANLVPPPAAARETVASLACEALDALKRSRAPYSGCLSGASVEVGPNRRLFPGVYLENAAFNPSMMPIASALCGARFAGCRLADVNKGVVMETQAPFTNNDLSQLHLRLVAPNAKFTHFFADVAH